MSKEETKEKLAKDILAILRAKYKPGMETFSFDLLMTSLFEKGYKNERRAVFTILNEFGMFPAKRGDTTVYRFNRWVMEK